MEPDNAHYAARYILKRKGYVHLTANNINHPNDFGVRAYKMPSFIESFIEILKKDIDNAEYCGKIDVLHGPLAQLVRATGS